MADPIKHDVGSGLVTAGWESFKGVGKAFAAVIAGPAVMLGAGGAAVGGTIGALGALALGTVTAVGFGTVIGAGLIGAVLAGTAGGLLGASAGGFAAVVAAGPIAAVGSLLGLARGGQRITRENIAAQNKIDRLTGARQAHEAAIFQAGQQSVVGAIQQQMEIQAQEQQKLAAQQEAAAKSKIDPSNFKKPEHTTHAEAALKSKSENAIGGPSC